MQNPNYPYQPYQYQPYQGNANPYLERLTNLQQYQQALQPQQPSLVSRIVDNFDSITAQDVPMNGQAIFIKSDGSEIQVRSWSNTGLIDRTTYKAILDAETQSTVNLPSKEPELKFDPFNELTEGIMKRFDNLDKQLSNLDKCLTTTKQASRSKRESDTE